MLTERRAESKRVRMWTNVQEKGPDLPGLSHALSMAARSYSPLLPKRTTSRPDNARFKAKAQDGLIRRPRELVRQKKQRVCSNA
jgi:hypothetical protein